MLPREIKRFVLFLKSEQGSDYKNLNTSYTDTIHQEHNSTKRKPANNIHYASCFVLGTKVCNAYYFKDQTGIH